MRTYKIAFFGTHNFATRILQGLTDSPIIAPALVLTQPDRPVGRKQELLPSPVKEMALTRGIPVETPTSLKQYHLPADELDFIVVAQYGLLVPKHILDFPKLGTINVHTSLLPEFRGASPIQSAILEGRTTTGVTIMIMDQGLDTGPILSQEKIQIQNNHMFADVENELAKAGTALLLRTLKEYASGELKPHPQDEDKATTCRKLSREDGKINWHTPTQTIYNQYRALTPWPGIWSTTNGKRLKFYNIAPAHASIEPGRVVFKNDKLYIGTQNGSIEALELQMEGKNKMSASSFIRGYESLENTILES